MYYGGGGIIRGDSGREPNRQGKVKARSGTKGKDKKSNGGDSDEGTSKHLSKRSESYMDVKHKARKQHGLINKKKVEEVF